MSLMDHPQVIPQLERYLADKVDPSLDRTGQQMQTTVHVRGFCRSLGWVEFTHLCNELGVEHDNDPASRSVTIIGIQAAWRRR